MPDTAPLDVVTATEALPILGLRNRSSISLMVKCGELTPWRKLPAGYLFLRSDIERLARERQGVVA